MPRTTSIDAPGDAAVHESGRRARPVAKSVPSWDRPFQRAMDAARAAPQGSPPRVSCVSPAASLRQRMMLSLPCRSPDGLRHRRVRRRTAMRPESLRRRDDP
jgi:hypothetical protein